IRGSYGADFRPVRSPSQTHLKTRLAIAMASAGGWLGGSLAAAEAPKGQAPAAAEATPARSIEEARKEFDALKAAREAAQRGQGTALPRVAVPELHTGLGDPRPTPGTKANPATDPAKKSANWLVDAMTKEPGSRRDGDRGRAVDSAFRESAGDGVGVEAALDDPQSAPSSSAARHGRGANAASEKEKSAEVPNPLNRYLAEWMTPRDYATLKPSLTEGLAADGAGASRGGLGEISLPASMSGGLSGITLPGGAGPNPADGDAPGAGLKSPAIAPPRENPYLQTFVPPAPPSPSTAAQPPVPAPAPAGGGPVMSPMPSSTPATPVAKPAVPDFARPAQDEKYFKQLKRF
ncbi:MAG TPA: hypothetical protein VGE76_15250, partial [Opitutaceae bacterium]